MLVESELSSLQSLEGDSAVWLVYEMSDQRLGFLSQCGCSISVISIYFICRIDILMRIIVT